MKAKTKTWDQVKLLPAKQCSQNNHLLLAVFKWFNEVKGVIPKGHKCWTLWVENNALCWMRSLQAGPLLAWQWSLFMLWWGCPDVLELGFNSHGQDTNPAEDSAGGDLEEPWPGSYWLRVQRLPLPTDSLCLPHWPHSQLLCPVRASSGYQANPKTSNFWLQALVLLCCQDAAGPDSSKSRLQRCSASNIFGCDTTEVLFH